MFHLWREDGYNNEIECALKKLGLTDEQAHLALFEAWLHKRLSENGKKGAAARWGKQKQKDGG